MELRDYLRMLRRGWPTVVVVTAMALALAAVYLALAPERYEATATVYLSVTKQATVGDIQQGSQFARDAAATYAGIIDSPTVLGPVADELQPSMSVGDLEGSVITAARLSTTLVDITASSGDAGQSADIANATATSAQQVIPGVVATSGDSHRALVRVQLIRSATEPVAPLSPNKKRVTALGLVLGLSLGLGLTIARQALDTRLRRPEDLRLLTEVPVLAALPRLRRSQRHSVVVRDDPASRTVEAYRSLRTNLSHLEDGDCRSLMFTAVADDRDGVQIPVNLAWSIAQAGRRVLLVDLDLRRSQVGEMLRVTGEQGLADVLAGKVDLARVLHDTPQPGLQVVLSGTPQRSPSDLLSLPVMSTIVRRMEQEYDYVILHAPPLLTYTDAAVVSRVTGQTLVVLSAGQTKAQELTTAMAALNIVHVEPLGLVVAGVRGAASDNSKMRSLWARSRSQAVTPPPAKDEAGWPSNSSIEALTNDHVSVKQQKG